MEATHAPASPRQTGWSDAELAHFHQLYALRSQLAGFAARRAATHVSEGGSAAQLEECHRAMCEAARLGDYDTFLNADMSFHRIIAAMTELPLFVKMWSLLEAEMRDFAGWAHRTLFHDLEAIADSHLAQVNAIRAGQPKVAEHAAQLDLDALWQMLSELPAEPNNEPDPVERVCGYVMVNLHRPLTLAFVAKNVAHLSVSRLAQLFRASRGCTFSAYVQGLRLRRAAALLEEGELPVQDIASRVGYADVSRFAAHFRRLYHFSPSQWRQQAISPRAVQTSFGQD